MTENLELAALRAQILALSERYAEIAHGAKPFIAGTTAVPPSGKVLGSQEMRFLVDSCLDFWLTTGRFNDQFEARLSAYLGVKRLYTVNSGSSANLVTLAALRELHGAGGEVIVPSITWVSDIASVLQCGFEPAPCSRF